jgi:NAD+ kinase
MMNSAREILLVVHPTKIEAQVFAQDLATALIDKGFRVVTNSSLPLVGVAQLSDPSILELAVVLGGDGTILRAAELVRGFPIPILGINLGNVGFLAEIAKPTLDEIVIGIESKTYRSEPRLILHFDVLRDGEVVETGWALNEVTIERNTAQMVELFIQIDGRPLSRWGCDGVICSTPTGSTAYAFSAGGPVVWPEVNALVLLPLAAHALFSRPMVVSPDSSIAIDVESVDAHLSADGIRKVGLIQHDRVLLTRDPQQVMLTHLENSVFTDRLVAKFKLPIEGWRGE